MDLPREVRYMVYKLLLFRQGVIRVGLFGPCMPKLLQVSKQIRAEALPLYCSMNHFHYHFHFTTLDSSPTIRFAPFLRHIRNVRTSFWVGFKKYIIFGEINKKTKPQSIILTYPYPYEVSEEMLHGLDGWARETLGHDIDGYHLLESLVRVRNLAVQYYYRLNANTVRTISLSQDGHQGDSKEIKFSP